MDTRVNPRWPHAHTRDRNPDLAALAVGKPSSRRLCQPPVDARSTIAVSQITTRTAGILRNEPLCVVDRRRISADVEDELGQGGDKDEHEQQNEYEAGSPPHS